MTRHWINHINILHSPCSGLVSEQVYYPLSLHEGLASSLREGHSVINSKNTSPTQDIKHTHSCFARLLINIMHLATYQGRLQRCFSPITPWMQGRKAFQLSEVLIITRPAPYALVLSKTSFNILHSLCSVWVSEQVYYVNQTLSLA